MFLIDLDIAILFSIISYLLIFALDDDVLFNSLVFLIFFPIVFFVYWFVLHKSLRGQNIFLLIASYIFYGWWDWRFLSLIILSTFVDFFIGQKIPKSENPRRLLYVSLGLNLGLLGIFKYFNFFTESFISLVNQFGLELDSVTISIILPVGISFYTFQTLSYTIDVYKKQLGQRRRR